VFTALWSDTATGENDQPKSPITSSSVKKKVTVGVRWFWFIVVKEGDGFANCLLVMAQSFPEMY
jgi:hypothetical protein